MKSWKPLPTLLCLLALNAAGAERPKLQFINDTAAPIQVSWLKTDSERILNTTVPPGARQVITTTLGHRFAVTGQGGETIVTSEVPVQAHCEGGVPGWYTQRIHAGGLPIVASGRVNPYALKEAAFLVDLLLANRPDVRTALVRSGARLCVIGWNEFTTDLPEFHWMCHAPHPDFPHVPAKDYRDARSRGTGGSQSDPFCTCAEENLLGYPGDPYAQECILIHELAHLIHLRGLTNVDATFDHRLNGAYRAAMRAGLWKAAYASVNHHEYFAEGVQCWFNNNRENDLEHNHVNTRKELESYDPALAALCREVFGDTQLKYTKPATRLTGHMAGYDPSTAPTFVWPERLLAVKRLISAKTRERNEAVRSQGAAALKETEKAAGTRP